MLTQFEVRYVTTRNNSVNRLYSDLIKINIPKVPIHSIISVLLYLVNINKYEKWAHFQIFYILRKLNLFENI